MHDYKPTNEKSPPLPDKLYRVSVELPSQGPRPDFIFLDNNVSGQVNAALKGSRKHDNLKKLLHATTTGLTTVIGVNSLVAILEKRYKEWPAPQILEAAIEDLTTYLPPEHGFIKFYTSSDGRRALALEAIQTINHVLTSYELINKAAHLLSQTSSKREARLRAASEFFDWIDLGYKGVPERFKSIMVGSAILGNTHAKSAIKIEKRDTLNGAWDLALLASTIDKAVALEKQGIRVSLWTFDKSLAHTVINLKIDKDTFWFTQEIGKQDEAAYDIVYDRVSNLKKATISLNEAHLHGGLVSYLNGTKDEKINKLITLMLDFYKTL